MSWMAAVWPFASAGPVPTTRSVVTRSLAVGRAGHRDLRLVGRRGRRDDGEHVDDERQGVAGLDHVALRLVAVGEVGGDVELQPLAGLDADQSLVPALDHAAGAERDA